MINQWTIGLSKFQDWGRHSKTDDDMLIRSVTLWLCTGFLVLAFMTTVEGQLRQVVLSPDCTDLTPASCTLIPETDAHGNYKFDYYTEDCPQLECATIDPQNAPYLWTDPNSGNSISVSSWFCTASMISYTTRVEANTGLPPGKKEDDYAYCNYLRLQDLLQLGNCRDVKLHTCADCMQAYYYWVCAIMFPQCATSPNFSGNTIYGPSASGSVSYVLTKPCRGLCFEVIRKCPPALQFQCSLKDTRDYYDWPNCNSVGSSNVTF